MNILLHIASRLYGVVVALRNWLYDKEILHSYPPTLPTICVGNLAVGGTGKTPHVEYLVHLLQEHGYRVAVLSRGYKRSTTGFVEADESSTTATIGDEAMQLKQAFPELIVAVCEDRVAGIRHLQALHPDLQCIVLDDAFQHRRLHAGYNIVLTQADRLYTDDYLLPLGRLREQAKGIHRTNCVVVTKCADTIQPIDMRITANKLNLPPYQPLLFTRMEYEPLRPLWGEGPAPCIEALRQQKVLLLTGIAQPHYLQEHVSKSGCEVYPLTFADHHAFKEADVQRIVNAYEHHHCSVIITTEKDAVRLKECSSFPNTLKSTVFVQPIHVVFLGEDQQTFNTNILDYVRKSTSDR